MLGSVEMCDCMNCHHALSAPTEIELCDVKSVSESQWECGCGMFAPPGGLDRGEQNFSKNHKVSFHSFFQRFADRLLEVLLGKVGVTHRHLQGAVTE